MSEADGRVFGWGDKQNGNPGIESYHCANFPAVAIYITEPVIAIAAGAFHSVCLAADGTVYTWGDGSCGQL